MAGWYLSISYLGLAAGALVAGWLSDRLGRRKGLYIIAGAIGVPAIWLMGRAPNLWALTVITAVTWFLGGAGLALGNILTGLFAGAEERGKVFGILSLTGGLGGLIGGLGAGWLVDRWGFPTMFTAVALFGAVWPLAALFVQDKSGAVAQLSHRRRPSAGLRPPHDPGATRT
jgi:AAHS family 4-hydroxybenzoate transporter-like MFS transporter